MPQRVPSAIQFSETPGLGCAQLGNLFAAMSDRDAMDVLETAWSAGVRYFDTAPHYGLGLSERRLGAFLRDKPRSEFIISTKVGRVLVATPGGDDAMDDEGFIVPATHRRVWDFSASGVHDSLESSRERLGLDFIDVALIHDPQDHPDQAIHEAAPALAAMRRAGVIGSFGAGTRDTAMLERLVREIPLDIVMLAGRFTLLTHKEGLPLLKLCEANGVRVINVGVFNSGIMASNSPDMHVHFEYGNASPAVLARARAIADACARHGIPIAHAAFSFATAHPAVTAAVLGADTPSQAALNAGLINHPSPPAALWADLDTSGLLDWVPSSHRFAS